MKCKWLVLRYWINAEGKVHDREDCQSSGSVFVTGSYFTGYVGMVFPDTLYPTPQHLPVRRVEVDVFKDLRR